MKFVVALLVMLVSGCASGGGEMNSVADSRTAAEPLHSIRMGEGKIDVGVISHGCTRESDFDVVLTKQNQLTVVRLRPDRCRRAPFVNVLTLTIPTSSHEWLITNPMISSPRKTPAKTDAK